MLPGDESPAYTDQGTSVYDRLPMGQRIMNTVEKVITPAQQNEQEFMMESVNGPRGNRQRRSMMEFNVHWAGFGESCNSWESPPCRQAPRLSTSQCNEDPDPK